MSVSPTPYSAPSRLLHWTMAILIILITIPIGLLMGNLPDGGAKNSLYELHKSFGMTVFVLAILRVGVRAFEGFRPLPSALPAWQLAAARATHLALYGLIVLVPILGFIGTSMCCAPVNYFWTVPIPLAFSGSLERAEMVLDWHKAAVFVLAAVLGLHLAAALFHRLVLRDGVFERMWPAKR
ncbi:cytochrome b [Microvirga antarctica]|uniref:cytochrome b n=1 Tax=Microvirga antarctica TaxID=2819233 RepID=UPI001B3062FB|nr:cytochrome b [Microvirga antarctica]